MGWDNKMYTCKMTCSKICFMSVGITRQNSLLLQQTLQYPIVVSVLNLRKAAHIHSAELALNTDLLQFANNLAYLTWAVDFF